MILKIFSLKNLATKSAFFTLIKGNFSEKVIITLVFEKNANFFAENGQKSQKIVITTSTLGRRGDNYFVDQMTHSTPPPPPKRK
jgi:hypothetical protein